MTSLLQHIKYSFIFFFLLLLIESNISAQSPYWQYALSSLMLKPESSGILLSQDNRIDVLMGSDRFQLSGWGKTLAKSSIPGASVANTIYFYDQREDILVVGLNRSFQEELLVEVYNQDGSDMLYSIPIAFQQVHELPYNAPVMAKLNDDSYFIFEYARILYITLDENGHTINYDLPHEGLRITDACIKEGKLYACDLSGHIRIFSENGHEESWFIPDVQPLGIAPSDDGFLLTGRADGQALLARIDDQGEVLWQKEYTGNTAWDVAMDSDQHIVLTGENADATGFVIKTDADGDLIWRSDILDFTGVQIETNVHGDIYALGRDFDSNGSSELVKLGANGEEGPELGEFNSFPLNVNNVKTSVSEFGQLFFDGSNAQFFFPNDAETATIFASALWMGARDAAGNTRAAAQQYFGSGDYRMGPMGADETFYQRVWSVSRAEMEIIKADMADGEKDMDWPLDILEWPAKGNTLMNTLGEQEYIAQELAPFIDTNDDGLYQPLDGDYPLIKGEQMMWWIFNDNTTHLESGGMPIEVEVIGNLYASGCNLNHPGDNTVYLDIDITNKSNIEYTEFYAGLWQDTDLGCYTDDYIGCIPDHNAAITYNEDVEDGQTGNYCPGSTVSYLQDVPIQSAAILNRDLDYYTYFNNPNVGAHPPATFDPVSPMEYLNYLTGKWRDGTPITEGGMGYNPASSAVVDHAFPGDPSQPNEWSLCTSNLSESDRRYVMSSDLSGLFPGQTKRLQLALITTLGSILPCPDLELVKADIESIQQIHDLGGSAYALDLGPDRKVPTDTTIELDAGLGATSYLWSNGSTDQSILTMDPGTYAVTVTDHYGCEHVDEIELLSPVGTGQIAEDSSVDIFPNPVSHEFSIIMPDRLRIKTVEVYSSAGRYIRRYSAEDVKANNYPTKELATGFYMLRITTNEGTLSGKLIVH